MRDRARAARAAMRRALLRRRGEQGGQGGEGGEDDVSEAAEDEGNDLLDDDALGRAVRRLPLTTRVDCIYEVRKRTVREHPRITAPKGDLN